MLVLCFLVVGRMGEGGGLGRREGRAEIGCVYRLDEEVEFRKRRRCREPVTRSLKGLYVIVEKTGQTKGWLGYSYMK